MDHGVVGSRGPTTAQEHAVVGAVDPPRLKTTAVFLLKLIRRLLFFPFFGFLTWSTIMGLPLELELC